MAMPHRIELSDSTFSRLQAHAVPLVDSPETMILRLLDAYEGKREEGEEAQQSGPRDVRDFDPFNPPDLTHTKVLTAMFAGSVVEPAETHWNGLMNAAVRFAFTKAQGREALAKLILINFAIGKKEDEGYRLLEGTGLSVQGQDANSAWRAVAHIARRLGPSVNVIFVWRHNERAAFPGVTGQMRIAGTTTAGTT